MKSPGTASHKASGKKAKASGKPPGKFPSKGQLRRDYKGEARREDASARREEADARHRDAEAAHYRAEGEKAQAEGYKKEAEYDFAKARREDAEARRDMARARHDQAKARRDRHKAARVGLAVPGARSGGWILGGNDWHEGCAAVALANHLLLATGRRVSDEDVLALHVRAAGHPQARVPILATLEAAARWGLGGWRPVLFGPALVPLHPEGDQAADCAADEGRYELGQPHAIQRTPLMLELDLTEAQRDQVTWDAEDAPSWGPHAGLLASDRVVSWGREVPVTADFLAQQCAAAWALDWAG